MIDIDDVIVSRDVVQQYFCCDLEKCKGACCIDGESGAPLLKEELQPIAETLESINPYLSKEKNQCIKNQGIAYEDFEGELVTSLVDGRDCVFTCIEGDGSCRCAFEKTYTEGVQKKFYKPISCHLYPIRITEYSTFTAVNYHKWHICEPAIKLGKKLNLRVYQFLKEPLIRRFGREWYEKLEEIAERFEV